MNITLNQFEWYNIIQQETYLYIVSNNIQIALYISFSIQ